MSTINPPPTVETTDIPPEPPDHGTAMDIEKNEGNSFRNVLLNKNKEINHSYNIYDGSLLDPQGIGEDAIALSDEDNRRIYQPWIHSVTIKLFGRKLTHVYLKNKLTDLWKVQENLDLIDLGNDYFIAKFSRPESTNKVLNEAPRFVTGSFLTIQKWEPNFVPHKETLTHNVIWVQLP